MNEWLKNFWYVIAEATELTSATQPLQKFVMGQRLALFIDEHGNYSAVNDVCPHMGSSFKTGKVQQGKLVCPYHHATFASTGMCVDMPCVVKKHERSVPDTFMLDSYPVVEKYGLLWIFLGDTPAAERPPIVGIPEFDDPEFRPLYSKYEWECDLRPLLENLIDFTHFSFLHGNTFGNADFPFRDEYEVDKTKWEVSCRVKVKFNTTNKVFPNVPELGANPDIQAYCRFHMPTVVVNEFSVGPYKDVTLFHFTPVDENTVVFGMMGRRNFDKSSEADEHLKGLGDSILEEDRVVIESCIPEILPRPVPIPVDRYLLSARNMYDHYLQSGHSVEPHVFATNRRSLITVIPSPVRQRNSAFGRFWQRRELQEQVKRGTRKKTN